MPFLPYGPPRRARRPSLRASSFRSQPPEYSSKISPVLASQTVTGRGLKEVLTQTVTPKFNQDQLTEMLFLGLLTRPGDAKASNFIYTDTNQVVSIDNDVSFVEPLVKTSTGQTVNFSSILHCLDRRALFLQKPSRLGASSPPT